jgi:hypothetical protein
MRLKELLLLLLLLFIVIIFIYDKRIKMYIPLLVVFLSSLTKVLEDKFFCSLILSILYHILSPTKNAHQNKCVCFDCLPLRLSVLLKKI